VVPQNAISLDEASRRPENCSVCKRKTIGLFIMLALLLPVCSSLLDTTSWNPAGRTGKSAQPDYKTIVARVAAAVPFEDLSRSFDATVSPVVEKAESGLRQFRGAFNSAPDYAKISSAMLALANSARLPEVAEESLRKAEGGLRQFRGAFNSAPDYATIASSMLASVSQTDDADEADSQDFVFAAPEPLKTVASVARNIPFWKEPSASASPDYGDITVAAALDALRSDLDAQE